MTSKTHAPATRESPPTLLPLIMCYMASQSVGVAARLGIADLLRDGRKSSEELAVASKTHAPSLLRLLRGLAAVGILEEVETGVFDLAPMGHQLRSEVPNSVRGLAKLFGDEAVWHAWGKLLEGVRTGENAWEKAFEMDAFEYIAENPEFAAIFNQAMTEGSRLAAPAVISVYDFSRFRTLVDVGGGNGVMIAAILNATPELGGVLFDRSTGLEGSQKLLQTTGVADRCEIVAGDFFESVPAGADAYLLKSVIHDWNDRQAIRILENCRRAIPPGGTLLVIEPVMPEQVERTPAIQGIVMSDLNMLVCTGGRERSEGEFRSLFESAGFRLTAVIPAREPSTFSVIEGVPV